MEDNLEYKDNLNKKGDLEKECDMKNGVSDHPRMNDIILLAFPGRNGIFWVVLPGRNGSELGDSSQDSWTRIVQYSQDWLTENAG